MFREEKSEPLMMRFLYSGYGRLLGHIQSGSVKMKLVEDLNSNLIFLKQDLNSKIKTQTILFIIL